MKGVFSFGDRNSCSYHVMSVEVVVVGSVGKSPSVRTKDTTLDQPFYGHSRQSGIELKADY